MFTVAEPKLTLQPFDLTIGSNNESRFKQQVVKWQFHKIWLNINLLNSLGEEDNFRNYPIFLFYVTMAMLVGRSRPRKISLRGPPKNNSTKVCPDWPSGCIADERRMPSDDDSSHDIYGHLRWDKRHYNIYTLNQGWIPT